MNKKYFLAKRAFSVAKYAINGHTELCYEEILKDLREIGKDISLRTFYKKRIIKSFDRLDSKPPRSIKELCRILPSKSQNCLQSI